MTTSSERPLVYENPEIDNPDTPGSTVTLKYGHGPLPEQLKNKKIFFFDIDNCLYERSTKIHDMMQVKIHNYFKKNLQLNDDEAHQLHMNYYKTYGLALEGLVRNHQVDALEYNSQVDDSLDLKSVLSFNQELRDMVIQIKESHHYDVLWLITNAYKNHALRVVSFLGLGDLFDGLTYCDYSECPIVCKPMDEFFFRCLDTVQVDKKDPAALGQLSFVDDSEINVKAAFDLGFGHVFHYVEVEKEYEQLKQKDDYSKYYEGSRKITILRNILELQKYA
ncbi:hypothetical protein FT663_04225 [Candidozyma haemuli var. vulneris]|uniref:Pyrimidine 5'-nucleotidase n=1 Tax=Candidozyma haemuli TaxID=45357 RepID=A0A2V1ARF4_9ASCO|nr:pyrimidine 5'-nucleotidase [[Candida] haemuloni]KAF3987998.1 hypothetical protein FT663_04225 [[Candida] haemuloni var. vulneris]KAF3991777.1 hypothetical protein FT662_01531 [[Candida] haemuloni var. vulneris]PVH20807.1 pyrimidine 5'-nucleotidase [[Candida] haemuloni]